MKDIDEKCPLFLSVVSQAGFTLTNSSLLQDKSEIILLLNLGNLLMIVVGWLEKVLIYSGVLLAFQKGKYFFVAKVEGNI